MKANKLGVMLLMLFMLAGLAQAATTWSINQTDAGANFSTLTGALSSGSLVAGDTIQFTDATAVTYTEAALNWGDLAVPANINLTALHPNTVRLNISQRLGDARTMTISNLNFGGNAGAMEFFFYASNPNITVDKCNFDLGNVGDGSACVWADGGLVTVTNSTFKNMVGGGSRALFCDWGATYNVTDCTFDNMQCSVFMGWANYACHFNLTRCTVTNCSTLDAPDWAVIVLFSGTANVTSCSLQSTGGRILSGRSGFLPNDTVTVNFKNTKLTKTGDGAAIRSQPGKKLVAQFDNCIFDGGWVNLFAEGTQADASTMTCNHCLFAKSTGAITFGDGYDTITIQNSIITAASLGINTGGNNMTVVEDYNLINMAGGYMTGTHDLDGRTTAIDPLFVDAAAGNYQLQSTSPLLGKGVASALNVDFNGDPRPQPAGTLPDIGPFESAYVPVELSSFSAE